MFVKRLALSVVKPGSIEWWASVWNSGPALGSTCGVDEASDGKMISRVIRITTCISIFQMFAPVREKSHSPLEYKAEIALFICS